MASTAALMESSDGAALKESSAAGLAWLFSTLVMTNARVMVMTARANFIFGFPEVFKKCTWGLLILLCVLCYVLELRD